MHIKKSDVKKIKNATAAELESMKHEYQTLTQNPSLFSNPTLIILCVAGIACIVYFHNSLFNFIGLVLFAYGLYTFASRSGHREGYLEGYYEMKSKGVATSKEI
jgi:hypothetical protein